MDEHKSPSSSKNAIPLLPKKVSSKIEKSRHAASVAASSKMLPSKKSSSKDEVPPSTSHQQQQQQRPSVKSVQRSIITSVKMPSHAPSAGYVTKKSSAQLDLAGAQDDVDNEPDFIPAIKPSTMQVHSLIDDSMKSKIGAASKSRSVAKNVLPKSKLSTRASVQPNTTIRRMSLSDLKESVRSLRNNKKSEVQQKREDVLKKVQQGVEEVSAFETHSLGSESSSLSSTLTLTSIEEPKHDLKPKESFSTFLRRRIVFSGLWDPNDADDNIPEELEEPNPCRVRRKTMESRKTGSRTPSKQAVVEEDEYILDDDEDAKLMKQTKEFEDEFLKLDEDDLDQFLKTSNPFEHDDNFDFADDNEIDEDLDSVAGENEGECQDKDGKDIEEDDFEETEIEEDLENQFTIQWDKPESDEELKGGGGMMLHFKESDSEEDDALTEKLCILQEQAKKPLTLKERYVGIQAPPGYPICQDRTEGHPECMPPGEIVRQAINTEQLWSIPEGEQLSRENFIKLMRNIENHPNNDYVRLQLAFSPVDNEFDPFTFKVIRFIDQVPNDYWTLSKSGFTHIKNGYAEFVSILQFETEIHMFDRIRKIKFFAQYQMWKPFRHWINKVRRGNIQSVKKNLDMELFFSKRPLRNMMLELNKMCEKLSHMGFLVMKPGQTYGLKEFLLLQETRLKEISSRLRAFEGMVVEMTSAACRSALIESGFSPDEYQQEMDYYMKQLSIPLDSIHKPLGLLDYPGQWLSYSQQSRKRQICKRLSEFIHLIDYYVQRTYHILMKNSMLSLMLEMDSRLLQIPSEYHAPLKHTIRMKALKDLHELREGRLSVSYASEPIFDVGCAWTEHNLIFSPSIQDYATGVKKLLDFWRDVVLKYPNMLQNITFNPYTQPIVNGHMDERTCGDGPSMELLMETDPMLKELRAVIDLILGHGFEVCTKYINTFDHIRIFCLENEKLHLGEIRTEQDVAVFTKLLERFQTQLTTINKIEDLQNMGLFRINNSILRQNAVPTIARNLEVLHEAIPLLGAKSVESLAIRMRNTLEILEKHPETADEYVAYLLYLDEIQEQMDEIERDLDVCAEIYDLIEVYEIPGSEEDYSAFNGLQPLLLNLRQIIDKQLGNREKLMEQLLSSFKKETKKIFKDMTEINESIMAPEILSPASDPQAMVNKLTEHRDLLLGHHEKAQRFNSYQKQLKVDVTNFDSLEELINEVKLRHLLWESIINWDKQVELWNNAVFRSLDDEEMTKEVNKYVKVIQQVEKGLPPNEVIPILKTKVDAMRSQLPLIANLHNPNMRGRHWEELEKLVGRSLTDDTVTLKVLNEIGIQNYSEAIQDVASQASSESSLESLLKKVEDSWRDVEFIVLPHKDQRDVFILGGTDDIQVLLDDSNIHMATIASSRHVGPIKHKVEEWSRLLDLFAHTLDEWLNCQRNWIYLESIFSAPDIQRQLPAESKLFAQVDKSWREIMQRTNKMPAALRAATQVGLLEALQMNNEVLEQIMKCLDDYLESKRVIFPRFYFLSNEELLEILAQTRNPQAVQPHLRKCFDAIQKLEFGATNAVSPDVMAMFSPEDERVPFTKGMKARGNVEEWLGKVEDGMFSSLKKIMTNTLTEYHASKREDWLSKFPSQCILTIAQLMWCQMVHQILDGPGDRRKGMRKFEAKNFQNLNNLAAMVRGQLAPLQRAVLCALITIDVHLRDIVSSLVHMKVDNSNNFEWLKQLRYYWQVEGEVVIARMANAQYYYGYEYLGASPRLVITPLTDRCYLCLMGALQLVLGGSPAGPAGTGKTETTKDLAKALAFMCVVFNCSEGLDYKMMGRFFSGLAQSGGWCCFDEFNRIDIEVLSVIAQQLMTIRLAKVQKLTRFNFEGREIKLVKTCATFVTMNPGYAGRTELPDNLKALFRPIAMMVPDYALIAEVILYSEGFESSKSLANKMTQMYKLCSEQLSQQDHYDFGMRAVKSVLVMAGSLKRSHPDINENIVLIRALRDSNLPKFLAHDAVLLQGIIQDLFPGVVIPEQDYGVLQRETEKCAIDKGLQAPECFTRKVIQLFETMVVRHGVMLVGPTGGGKTCIYEVLKASLASLYATKVEGHYYRPVDTYVLNPKSISLGELYGEVNPLTFEWKDGLLGIMMRNAVKPKNTYHQWIVCDGPVDAIWIENMNTVLDDNKMLCLANSERIKLTNWVRMLFEVQDLSQASPATVSRCGMVYVDPKEMGWKSFVQTWLNKHLGSNEEVKGYLGNLFMKHVDSGLVFVEKNCKEVMAQSTIGKLSMMCSILEALVLKRGLELQAEGTKLFQTLCQIFVFAYLWSIGGNIGEKDYEAFESFVRKEFDSEEQCKLPKTGQLWNYYNNLETRKMDYWENIMPRFIYNPAISFVDILVPTVDTVRYGFLMELFLSVNKAVLFTGPTGTGKSAIAKYVLTSIATKSNYLPNFINFSAQTTSKRTQEMIEGKLEKRKKALLSAPMGKKVIVFIDDLNMPRLDRYGSQPALELLRQFLDFNGCFDRHKLFWKELQNVTLCGACGVPGGGRNAVSPRLLRHFAMLAIPPPDEVVLKQIYRAIMRGFLEEFAVDVREMADQIVNTSIATYQFMAQTFLPTPSKSHYVFNMRDLSKCIQGVLQANKSVVHTRNNMTRLFFHECQRVFHDRLTDDADRSLFCKSLAELCSRVMGEKMNAEQLDGIIFGDFMKMGVDREFRVYDEITNKDKLKKVLGDYLDEYNISTSKEMNLVFFTDAAEHVTRIARILRTDRGNALLVGVGGMGKQSLTRLSSYICGYQCSQIELMRGYDYASFHEDLKKLYETAGMKNEPIVFLFTDTQIAYEEFLEDINNILNSGEVPNLLEPEDQERMLAGARADAKNVGINENDRDAVYDYFIRRIRSNLHIVLCMSPVGDNFRIRCRMFPSLVNCCTINWFSEWPYEALLSVAQTLISKIDLGKGVSTHAMAEISVLVHQSVTKTSEIFYRETKRKYYTTPSSYLELITLYTGMLNLRRQKIVDGKSRIQNGLTKLLETNELVKEMRIQLRQLEPVLIQKSQAVENLMLVLAEDQAAADVVRRNVSMEEATAKEKAMETQVIAEDAQRDLAEALPALEAAVKSLDALDQKDIAEVRSFQKPPELVRTVMETVCILFGLKADWNSARQMLNDAYFLKKLYDYDKDSVSEATLKKLKVYMDNPQFTPEKVSKVSKACKSICLWVRAIDFYAKVFKTVEPKRNRYLAAQGELDQVMETLRTKQAQLNEVEQKIATLQQQFENSMNEKAQLEDNIELTGARLRRASKLTSALASEQSRWAESVQEFDEELKNLVGDVFVGAACIAYFGAFTSFYRQQLVSNWIDRCRKLGLPVANNFTLVSFADPYEVRVWNASGLPRDITSTENAILATRAFSTGISEIATFLAAVSAFAVFLLVIFIYVNKKWRFFNVNVASGPLKAKPSQNCAILTGYKGNVQFKTQLGEAYSIAPESSSDEEDVLRRLRHQNSLDRQQQQYDAGGNISGNGGGPNINSISTSSPSRMHFGMRTISLDHYQHETHRHHHPLQAQRSFDYGNNSPSLNTVVAGPPHYSGTARPLRVASLRDMDDVSSSRRRQKGLMRSSTGPVRQSSDASDLMSLAEKGGKAGGESCSASSTSSNVSTEDDPHQQQQLQHGMTMAIRHPHHAAAGIRSDSSRSMTVVSSLALQQQSVPIVNHNSHSHNSILPSNSASSSMVISSANITANNTATTSTITHSSHNSTNFRRMMMPPRTKSVDSESPPPSEQGCSTYGDSINDQDDQIFEVEEMSMVEGDLGIIMERTPNPNVQSGSVEVAFDYEAAAKKMTVHIIQARNIPPKDIGGANHTQVRVVLLPSRKQKHKTKVRPGENPNFMESFVFKCNPEDVSSMGIRFRLYGCERMRRERLLGECILGFGSLLELETTLWLNFEPRYHLSWDSHSDTNSLARSDSASSTASIQNGIPELLLGLAYNGTTGRLTCEIIKGSHFRNLAGGKAPDSYIKLVLMSCSGQEMGRAKSSLRRHQSNPLFKETFIFQVALFQIPEVTLLVSIYGRKGVTRRELLGWFALGYNSSGDEETTHWEDMVDAQGEQMCRWHVLLQS